MNHSEMKVGMVVYFGRTHGERTLGEVIKVNPTKVKVRQLEARGTMRDYAVGTVWGVPASLCTLAPEGTVAVVLPEAKRPLPAPRRRMFHGPNAEARREAAWEARHS
jgi:hypothetical protein